jgi:poly(A) polymerase
MTKEQLDQLLLARDVEVQLEGLCQNGTLAQVFPEVHVLVGFGGGKSGHKDLWPHTKKVVAQCVPRLNVRWAALFHDVGKVKCFTRGPDGEVSFHGHEAVSAKLFMQAVRRTQLFSREEADWIRFLIYHLGHVEEYDDSWTDSAVRRVHTLAGPHFEDLMALAQADVTTMKAEKRAQHHERVSALRKRALEIAAKDAIPPALPKGLGDVLSTEFGIPKSKALGDLMKKLTTAVEEGKLPRQPSFDECFSYVRTNNLTEP